VNNEKLAMDELSKFTSELLDLARDEKKLVTEAYIRIKYANRLREEGKKEEAFSKLETAIDILAGLGSDEPENGISPRSLYKQAFTSITSMLKEEEIAGIDFDDWVREYLARPLPAENHFYSDGLAILKKFYADHLFDKKGYGKAKIEYEDLLIAFPRDKNFSSIKDNLKEIGKELETDRYRKFLKYRRYALFTCPLVAICILLLLLLLVKKWPEIYITSDRTGIFEKPMALMEESNADIEKDFSLPFLNYNDPLAYLVLRVWRPSFLRMFFSAFCFMFLLHFIVALFDNNLYYQQNGVLSGISELATGKLHKLWTTFSTIPRGYQPWEKEYFFNDYYGLIVNCLINPLVFVTYFGIYCQFEKVWLKLFSQRIIRPRDNRIKMEICQYLMRVSNQRWHFWVSIIISFSVTFYLWCGVSNQPDRASYLDFGEGVMPIYHGLYLSLIWYMLVMMVCKILTSVVVLHKIFKVYAREGKVEIHLEPLHPDHCCGMSSVGRYALLLHLLVFLFGISVSARVFLDFVLIGSQLQKQPPLILGIAVIVVLGFFVFFVPLYIVRERMISVKNNMLEQLNREHGAQQEKFLKMLHDDHLDRQHIEYLQELAKIHAQIRSIPPWPFDLRTLGAFSGTIFLPIILPLIIQFLLELC